MVLAAACVCLLAPCGPFCSCGSLLECKPQQEILEKKLHAATIVSDPLGILLLQNNFQLFPDIELSVQPHILSASV